MNGDNKRFWWPKDNAFLRVVDAYVSLLDAMEGVYVHDGLKRLFVTQSNPLLSLSMDKSDITMVLDSLSQDKTSDQINTEFAQRSVCRNGILYLDLLDKIIRSRLETISHITFDEHPVKIGYENNTKGYYYPTAGMMAKIRDLTHWVEKGGFESVTQNTVHMATFGILVEFNAIVGQSGVYTAPKRCDQNIITFLENRPLFLDYDRRQGPSDFKRIVLPLLQIYLSMARLLCGAVDRNRFSETTVTPPECIHDLCISNTTLAALPLPTVELATNFNEGNASLSFYGYHYLTTLTEWYLSNPNTSPE